LTKSIHPEQLVKHQGDPPDPGMEKVQGMAKKQDIKQIDRIVKEEGLTMGQREILHEEITKQGRSLEEIREIAKEIKKLYPNH